MSIEITEFERHVQERNLFSQRDYFERGRKLHFDNEHEMRLFFEYNAVHKKYIEIQGRKYEQVDSDNLNRLKQGAKPIYFDGRQYIPVRKELKP